jgi:hypothetical protein
MLVTREVSIPEQPLAHPRAACNFTRFESGEMVAASFAMHRERPTNGRS